MQYDRNKELRASLFVNVLLNVTVIISQFHLWVVCACVYRESARAKKRSSERKKEPESEKVERWGERERSEKE